MKPVYLVVTPFFPSPESWRGAYCYDFVRALMCTERYDVRVFVPGRGADYDYQGVHVYRFPVKMLPSAVLPFLFAEYNRRSFLRKVASVGVDVAQVAVCHGHTATFGIYPLAVKAKNPRCLTLLHHHDPASFGLNNGRLRHCWLHQAINFFLLRRLHEAIDLHVFISEVVRKSFLAVPDASWTVYEERKRELRGLGRFRGVRMKAGVVLHNGVETRIFHPQPEERPGDFVIGCIANFSEGKDQLTLLKAAVALQQRFPRLLLKFVGSGESLAACQAFAWEHRLNAIFLKEVEHDALPAFYRSLDLFVLPSVWDGFGCVFTEAWASGVPFIASTQVGVCDLIPESERGLWLFPPGDSATLGERIAHFITARPKQHLTAPVDYDALMASFVCELEEANGGAALVALVTSGTGRTK